MIHIIHLLYELNIALKQLFFMLFPNCSHMQRPNNHTQCGMPSCHAMIFSYLLCHFQTMPFICMVFCYKEIFDRYIYEYHTILQLLVGTIIGILVAKITS